MSIERAAVNLWVARASGPLVRAFCAHELFSASFNRTRALHHTRNESSSAQDAPTSGPEARATRHLP